MKIITKLNLCFVLVGVFPSLLTGMIGFFYYNARLNRELALKQQFESTSSAVFLQQHLDTKKEQARMLAELPTIVVPLEFHLYQKFDETLKNLVARYDLASIEVRNTQRQVIAAYPLQNAVPIRIQETSLTAYIERIASSSYLTIIAPIFTRERETFQGYLVLRQELSRLVTATRSGMMARISDNTTCREAMKAEPQPSQVICSPVRNVDEQEIAALLVRFDFLPYRLFRSHSLLFFAMMSVSGLLFMALLRHVVKRSMLQPMLRLQQAAEMMSGGNYTVRAQYCGVTELDEFSKDFNAMADMVHASFENSRKFNEQLERLIAERTAELTDTHQRLQLARTQLMTQQHLAALGQLTVGIAHEVKNPLNFVSGFSQLMIRSANHLREELDKERPDKEEVASLLQELPQFAEDIRRQNDRAVEIINAMLDHARSQRDDWRPTRLNQLVGECVRFAMKARRISEPNLTIRLAERYAPELDEQNILIIPQEITRALLNILTNAFDEFSRKQASVLDYQPEVSV